MLCVCGISRVYSLIVSQVSSLIFGISCESSANMKGQVLFSTIYEN